jgi:hypothetical protein
MNKLAVLINVHNDWETVYKTSPVIHFNIEEVDYSIPNLMSRFSDTIALSCSTKVQEQCADPYKTAGKVVVLYILILTPLDRVREDKTYRTSIVAGSTPLSLSGSIFLPQCSFDLLH